ncbi:hypothetical protein GX411_05745 [Candidatus Fermentibacteria bacterium]|nr:hypothetical protein [Candidatus Fermentibacteria bacterium]
MNVFFVILLSVPASMESPLDGWFLDAEAGMAFSNYNDVRIPGDSGTEFSLTEDFETDPAIAVRLRIGRTLGERHHVSLFAAPLRFEAGGAAGEDISYNGTVFPAGTDISASYRFDSYRFTYRYDLVRNGRLTAAAGFTVKVRDAAIHLEGGGLESTKSNTGLVPLVSFSLDWAATGKLHLLLDGDALAAPQGRAEDVFLGAGWAFDPGTVLRAGYRILEGGADNDEVYNFTMVSFAALGFSLAL